MFGEKEIDFIEYFKMIPLQEIALIGNEIEMPEIINIVRKIHDWVDSSGMDQKPPDFYNEKEKIMMEVMRVDDHGYKKHGKIINPTYMRENEVRKELKNLGFDALFPNAKLVLNVDTGLSTNEDHNYEYYYKNFQRTVINHCEKIENYRENHKNYKLIFFIYDESTAYIEADEIRDSGIYGKPHLYYLDKRFVECFLQADIDYLIWMAPYKRFHDAPDDKQLPKVAIYDLKNFKYELIEYKKEKMVSSEK